MNGYLNNAIKKFEEVKQNFSEDSTTYRDAKDQVHRWEHTLNEARLKMKFVRPSTQEDIEYRDNIYGKEFSKKLQEICPEELDLRFHGTPIYFAEQIIKSGKISSTVDRYDGYMKSTDMKGEISASNKYTISRTIDFFSNIVSYNRGMPCGCIFALLPKDEQDATLGPDILKSVDFRKNPEQLFGIFTTPENVERVKQWMSEVGLESDIVYTFEGFLESIKQRTENKEEKTIKDNELEMKEQQFEETDALEIAKTRKTSGIVKLQERIRNAIKELTSKLKFNISKGKGENTNDESTTRD